MGSDGSDGELACDKRRRIISGPADPSLGGFIFFIFFFAIPAGDNRDGGAGT